MTRLRAAAFDGDWGPYLASLRSRGVSYARAGVGYVGWTDAFQRLNAALTYLCHLQVQAPSR